MAAVTFFKLINKSYHIIIILYIMMILKFYLKRVLKHNYIFCFI